MPTYTHCLRFHRYGHHPALPSFPTRRSSDLTPTTPTLSEAEALTVVVPETVAPDAGDVMLTASGATVRSEEHTSELQSQFHLVCRLLLEKKKKGTPCDLVGFTRAATCPARDA